ncbi:hypothetical protein DXG01_006156 [Tephrocybe rancida]|nr:hypothetical protein DXG01_006156 [Tephrocybe rancida]
MERRASKLDGDGALEKKEAMFGVNGEEGTNEHRLHLEGIPARDQTHRRLKNRHIQLIGIGGTVGTALFVQIGSSLTKGGPGKCIQPLYAFRPPGEVNVNLRWSPGYRYLHHLYVPDTSTCASEDLKQIAQVRFADRFVDPALGFAAGYNFFVLQASLVPFEVTAFNLVLQFWTDKIPLIAVIFFVLVLYAALNLFAVKWYGESEFWLALGKVALAVGMMAFTFVTMVGGNPLHDKYGFRNWNPARVPGAPFAEYIETGSLGKFLGFLACLIQASFTIAGPDYVAMTAGEAEFPRRNMPVAFTSVFYRLTTFFVLGALCLGIVVPYSDPDLLSALSNARPGAASSPYVIAMQHLHISVLPHIVNALILTAVFSAAFLQVSNNASVVLQWFVNLVTASQLINYAIVSFTYIRFHKALKAQGISRDDLPHKTAWQPFCGYYGLIGTLTMAIVGGYTVFLPGNWDVPTFLFSYAMVGIVPVLFVFWKILHKTQWRRSKTITFFEKERHLVDEYETTHTNS